MADRVALITGTTGQDGAYLAELLLGKGYLVHPGGRDEAGKLIPIDLGRRHRAVRQMVRH